jgi:hypothetical protein
MADSIKNSKTASTNHIIGTMFGKESLAQINIEFSSKVICNEVMRTSFSSAFITPLNNIFSPFSTKSEDYPSLIKDSAMQESNRVREKIVDYDNIDGLDFSMVPNKYSYHKPFGIDYNVVPTIGDKDGEEFSDYDLNTRNYDYDQEFRTVGFKLPSYFAGYGLDTVGRPIPSVYDEQKKNESINNYNNEFVLSYSGQYPTRVSGEISYLENSIILARTTSGNITDVSGNIVDLERKKNTYMDGYNVNPSEWPAGPLDVRWDKYRGVWAACPVIVEGYLLNDVIAPSGRATKQKYTSGEIVLYTGQYDKWDIIQPIQKVWVINRSVGLSATSGSYIAAQFFPNGEFRPIWVDCSVDPSGAINESGIYYG